MPAGFGRVVLLFAGACVLVAGALLFGHALNGSAGSPDPAPAKIAASSSIPSVQTVGIAFTATISVANKGGPVDDLVLDLGGCSDHWVVDDVGSSHGPVQKDSAGEYYNYGLLAHGDHARLALTMTPKVAGNHDCDMALWSGLDATGVPSGDAPLASVSASVAINP